MLTLIALLLAPTGSVWNAPLALEGQIGLSPPSGHVAVGLDWTIEPWLAVNAGVGQNFSGTQWAVMPRIQYVFTDSALALGLGLSGGGNKSFMVGQAVRAIWAHAFWLNAEGAWVRRDGQWQTRWALGYGYILNDQSCQWDGVGSCESFPATTLMPYIQYSMGYVF